MDSLTELTAKHHNVYPILAKIKQVFGCFFIVFLVIRMTARLHKKTVLKYDPR